MNRYDLVKVKGKKFGVVLIPSFVKREGLFQYKTFNLIQMEDDTLKAVKDEDLEVIQTSIEE